MIDFECRTALSSVTSSDVSRETMEKLGVFVDLLARWNSKINLVGPSTLQDVWDRHIVDSAQLLATITPGPSANWIDVGSGAGLPGLVISILLQDADPIDMYLVEADGRKAAFLRTVRRELDLNLGIHNERVETLSVPAVDILSARAFAPLERTLSLCEHIICPNTVCIMPKGRRFESEIMAARTTWDFTVTATQSITQEGAAILRLEGITRAKI